MPYCDASICPGLLRLNVQQLLLVTQWRIAGIVQVMRGAYMSRSMCGDSSTT